MRIDRDQLLRLATFWLRPDFVLRVVARFQKIAGFDRAIALASSAFTATIPLTILIAAVLPNSKEAADRIVNRYDLSGDGAAAVRDAFSPASDVDTGVGIAGTVLLLFAVLSFTRAIQRLVEQTWELPPLSVRNSANGLRWLGVFILFIGISGVVHATLDGGVAEVIGAVIIAPLTAGFTMVSGRILSGNRLPWREFVAFGVIAAGLSALYELAISVYAPYAFDSYAARYGVIGVVLAMISSLFGWMLVFVGSAVLGYEVRRELDNIRDGIRPSEDEVKKQWDIIMADARARRDALRAWLAERRSRAG